MRPGPARCFCRLGRDRSEMQTIVQQSRWTLDARRAARPLATNAACLWPGTPARRTVPRAARAHSHCSCYDPPGRTTRFMHPTSLTPSLHFILQWQAPCMWQAVKATSGVACCRFI